MRMEDVMKISNTLKNYFEDREPLITVRTKTGAEYGLTTASLDYYPGFLGLAMDDTYVALAYDSIESITA